MDITNSNINFPAIAHRDETDILSSQLQTFF